ncbi:AP-1 complex subunit gamma-2 [Acorus calamus]|uniref:AP-1 complex subunit gamma-2 n=1 Tax=Acorus calamus TaxID=4465 RepID=A0AAV9EXE3_ACOCL|nr:AP-1 complex subunit gamma-2 [Acorus calamus]
MSSNSPYAPDYDIAGITDPFLQIRALRLMRTVGQGDADSSDLMNDILATGNAILYECVETIMGIEATSGLRVLAINILGKFLSNCDNNIRYVALNMLMKAAAVDAQAVQRHRATILECVKDSDASIRKRALELVFLLVNDTNVKPLTKELIEYLEDSDQEFKGDLTAKICSIVEKKLFDNGAVIIEMLVILKFHDQFSSGFPLISFGILIRCSKSIKAGNFVKDEIWHTLIVVISNALDLHGYTVRSLYKALQSSCEQESLVRVAVWCIGEYGELLINNIGVLDIEEPITMPVLDELAYHNKKSTSTPANISSGKTSQVTFGASVKLPNGVAKSPAAPTTDLLDLRSDGIMQPMSSGGDFLHDLLDIGFAPSPSSSGNLVSLHNLSLSL